MKTIIDVLKERGFIDALTSDDIYEVTKEPILIYCGFDPTSDSLHLGNLVSIMGLAWFQKFGHTPVAIVGGATGMIGDPSGKSHERNLLDESTLTKNLEGITQNLKQILNFECSNKPLILNNFDWFKNYSFIDFLREIGKHFRVSSMLAKDAVKSRITSEEGISYTEFSYQLLQSYDFLYLFQKYGVKLQLGGSDQWGNITAGTELVRKVLGKSVYGATFPLLTRSDGKKFGKSEKGAIWLSAEKLSPYEFYQHLIRTTDEDVIKLLRMLTFLPMEEIHAIESSMKESNYIPNTAQKKLAEEVTRIVHGEENLIKAIHVTKAAAPGAETSLDSETLMAISKDFPTIHLKKEEILNESYITILLKSNLANSRGAARRLIEGGGVYLNNQKITNPNEIFQMENLIDEKMFLLSLGKKNKLLINVE